MGLTPVPPTEVATIVTTLEMAARPRPRPLPESRLRLVPWRAPALPAYRTLFERIGAPWLWFSRLVMDDARLAGIIHDRRVSIFAAIDPGGVEVGMLELDHRVERVCELSYVGLIPELVGRGHGRWLLAHALHRAWTAEVERVWVHTCTLDHPRALGVYRAAGFSPVKRTVETFPDPRLTGILPRGAAPHVPLLDSLR